MKSTLLTFLTVGCLISGSAQADLITLGGPLPTLRTASLSSAVAGSGRTGTGNGTESDIEGYYGGDWTERSNNTAIGTNGLLTIALTTGSFGSTPAAGTWTVASNFWTLYGQGAISMHVGNGGGEPDHFAWKITPGQLTGTWSYDGTGIGGGGLSNLKLYSTGSGRVTPPSGVPDTGATIALLGLALLGLAGIRRVTAFA